MQEKLELNLLEKPRRKKEYLNSKVQFILSEEKKASLCMYVRTDKLVIHSEITYKNDELIHLRFVFHLNST